jgi:serine protease Do
MSAKVRYWSFAGLLAAGVAAAVSVAVAQGPAPRPSDTPERGARRSMMMLDGRGSRLGVMVQDLDSADKASGVRIDSVDSGSAAEKAGIRAGDIVVEYDGERVRSTRQFTRLVQETAEGRSVAMAVMRDGKRQTLTATPEAPATTWNMSIDSDRIRRDVERSLEGLSEFRMDMPAMRFHFENDFMPSRRRLGVSVDSLSDQLAQYFGAADGGALVTSVEPDSAAAKSGLKAGDVITSINGSRVHDAEQLRSSIRDAKESDVSIGYLRDKKAGTTKATLPAPADRSQERRPEERRPVRPAAYRPA